MLGWLGKGELKGVSLVITSAITGENLEKWDFDIQTVNQNDGDVTITGYKNLQLECFYSTYRGKASNVLRWLMNLISNCFCAINRRQRDYGKKELAEIQKGIRNVMRQVTATVTFLPLLDARCAFDLRIYLAKRAEVATGWVEETDTMIENPEKVQLRGFSTSIHRVNSTVTYKADT